MLNSICSDSDSDLGMSADDRLSDAIRQKREPPTVGW